MIDPKLQESLDGERDPSTLSPDQRETYRRMSAAVQLVSGTPQFSVADRVMAEIREFPEPRVPRAPVYRVWPAWAVALAAVLGALVFLPVDREPSLSGGFPAHTHGIAEFVGHFPGARSVEVVGSFNNWSRGALALRDDNNDGIWHGDVVLPAGQHEYMFVVDGDRWVADPLAGAGRYVDDGFGIGRENSVLIVRPAAERP
jgi:hypothetical protein